MPVTSKALDSLEKLLGAESVTTAESELAKWNVDGVRPGAIASPASTEQLGELVRWAGAENVALVPATSGRLFAMGNPPRQADVIVSLRGMNRITDYDPGDLTVSAEAGATLPQLNGELAGNGQHLPADPPFAAAAGMGGLIATNSNGPLRQGFGTWRDYVMGLEFVTGSGNAVKGGGRVVKNVAGYDLTRLLIGSLGSLGIITRIHLKAFPRPEGTATSVASFDSLEAALALRSAVAHSVLQPSRMELLDGSAAAIAGATPLAPDRWNLVLSYGGVAEVVARHRRDLEEMSTEAGASSFAEVAGDKEAGLWQAVTNLLERAATAYPNLTVVKCPLPMTQLEPFIEKATAVAGRYGLKTAVTAHAGTAVAHIYYLAGPDDEDVAFRAGQAATESVHAGNNLQGRVTLPWTFTEVKRNVNPWGPLKDDFALMKKLKARFDPRGILNPGRFMGGL